MLAKQRGTAGKSDLGQAVVKLSKHNALVCHDPVSKDTDTSTTPTTTKTLVLAEQNSQQHLFCPSSVLPHNEPAPAYQSPSPPPTSPSQQPPQPLPLPLHSSPLSPRAGIAAATAQPSGAACGVMWPTGKSASPVPSSEEALSVGRAPAPGSVGMRGVSERGRPPQSQVHT